MNQIDVKDHIPAMIRSTKRTKGIYRKFPAVVTDTPTGYRVEYDTLVSNQFAKDCGVRRISRAVPKNITKSVATFEVLGFLQGEMSKTHRGPLTFCNSEPSLMRKALSWFAEEFDVSRDKWSWYIKMNIAHPGKKCVLQMQSELIEHWLLTGVVYEKRFPTTLSFIGDSAREVPANDGTLIVERRGPVFVQTFQLLVNNVFSNLHNEQEKLIVAFLRGLLAAEACINFRLACCHRRVFVCAAQAKERAQIQQCLTRIGVQSKDTPSVRAVIVSGRANLERLDELGLLLLHPVKYARFREMVDSYQ